MMKETKNSNIPPLPKCLKKYSSSRGDRLCLRSHSLVWSNQMKKVKMNHLQIHNLYLSKELLQLAKSHINVKMHISFQKELLECLTVFLDGTCMDFHLINSHFNLCSTPKDTSNTTSKKVLNLRKIHRLEVASLTPPSEGTDQCSLWRTLTTFHLMMRRSQRIKMKINQTLQLTQWVFKTCPTESSQDINQTMKQSRKHHFLLTNQSILRGTWQRKTIRSHAKVSGVIWRWRRRSKERKTPRKSTKITLINYSINNKMEKLIGKSTMLIFIPLLYSKRLLAKWMQLDQPLLWLVSLTRMNCTARTLVIQDLLWSGSKEQILWCLTSPKSNNIALIFLINSVNCLLELIWRSLGKKARIRK